MTVYALDATIINLCLSVFPWAPFRITNAVIKLHTLLDLRGNIPSFIHISDGKLHEVNVLSSRCPPSASPILYRCRRQVELFFKWIKQHLRIRGFFGTFENANRWREVSGVESLDWRANAAPRIQYPDTNPCPARYATRDLAINQSLPVVTP